MRRVGPAMPRSKPVRVSVDRLQAAIAATPPTIPEMSVPSAIARNASHAQNGGCPPRARKSPQTGNSATRYRSIASTARATLILPAP